MSLFDTPKPFLNPELWNPDKSLKPERKTQILDILSKVFPLGKVYSATMIGSSVGYQYSDTSDVDVNVVARRGETFDYWHLIFKKYNRQNNYLPGTKHPVNFFFQEYTADSDWSNSLGAYDLFLDKWVKNPMDFSKIGDPEEKFEREIAYGKMMLAMVDSQVSRGKEAKLRGDTEGAHRIYTELAIFFKSVDENRKTAYRFGTGTPALQEYNIMYKLIEASPHAELFHKLVDFYDETYGNTVES